MSLTPPRVWSLPWVPLLKVNFCTVYIATVCTNPSARNVFVALEKSHAKPICSRLRLLTFAIPGRARVRRAEPSTRTSVARMTTRKRSDRTAIKFLINSANTSRSTRHATVSWCHIDYAPAGFRELLWRPHLLCTSAELDSPTSSAPRPALAAMREWPRGSAMTHLLDYMIQPSHLLMLAAAGFLLFGSIGLAERRRGR